MMFLVNLGIIIFSVFISLFLLWKRLREDYSSYIIFSCGFTIFALALAFGYGSTFLGKQWLFWFSFLGGALGLAISMFRFKMRFFETFEAFSLILVPCLSLYLLYDSVKTSSLPSFLAFAFTLLLMFVFAYIDINYKSFTWYKSGRIGLAGLVMFLLLFLARIIAYLLGLKLITIVPVFELYLCGFIVIMTIWQLYRIQKI